MRRLLTIAAAVLAIASWQGTSSADSDSDEIVVVVNKSNPAHAVTRADLRPIFQTVKTTWPDGTNAEPFNLPEDNATRQAFDAVVLDLDPDRVARYWVDRKIRGGERPPRKASSPGAVLRGVAADKGGVGYVRAGESNDTVKIVARIKNGSVMAP